MSLWLSKKRKGDLVELAEQLGIETDGHLKSDIENLISSFLDEHSENYQNDPTFAPYFDSLGPKSPSKSVSAMAILPEGTTRSRRRTSRYVPGTGTREDSIESTPEPASRRERAGSRALTARTPRSRVAAGIPLPPSPAVVADAIESRSRIIAAKAKEVANKAAIGEKVSSVRDKSSNLISVIAVFTLYETARVLGYLIPIIKAATVPSYEFNGFKVEKRDLHFPDLFVLLSIAFWSPVVTWLTVGYILPALNGYFFNLALNAPKGRAWKVDPVAFGVTKGLLAYLVYWRGFNFWGALSNLSVGVVSEAVGKEAPLIGSAIVTLGALYVAILKK